MASLTAPLRAAARRAPRAALTTRSFSVAARAAPKARPVVHTHKQQVGLLVRKNKKSI